MEEKGKFNNGDRLRDVLMVFLKFERIITVSNVSKDWDFDEIKHPKITTGLKTHQLNFLKLLNITVNDIDLNGMYEHIAINKKVSDILDEFVQLEIIVRVGDDTSAFINIEGIHQAIGNCSYKLSAKGLDIVLKLQEHNDNKDRIERQINISKLQVDISNSLKINSGRALWVSIGALFLSVCFLVISACVLKNAFDTIKIGKEQLKISQSQLKLSQQRIKLLESERTKEIPHKEIIKKPN